MLNAGTLRQALARFCDSSSNTFEGFPTTRTDARHRWAHAFRVYFAEFADFVGTAPLVTAQASLAASSADDVETAFFAALRLDTTAQARPPAEDFADAWRAAMRAVRPGLGGRLPPSATPYAFVAWQPDASGTRDVVDLRRDILANELTALFAAPARLAPPRLEEIAQAFHRATFELTATSSVSPLLVTYR